jgi:membrane protein YqaA with SNARE-associated domain
MNPFLMYATCFGLSIVSALLPWVNGEVLMLSFSAFARSPLQLAFLVLLASAGQMTGKCILYWVGRGAIPIGSGRIGRKMESWRGRFSGSSPKSMWLVFASAVSGIPPFYATTLFAGVLRLRFSKFIAVGAAGRLLHFGILALVPQLFTRVSQYFG